MFALTKPIIKLYSKIRHRHGHGIHSPFVFHLIENVIENKLPYYAYSEIERTIEKRVLYEYKTKKINRLIFEIIHFTQVKNILEIGSGKGINTLYATAPSKEIECICVEKDKENRKTASTLLHSWQQRISIVDSLPETNQKFDCIILDFKFTENQKDILFEYLFSHIHENSVIILNNIRTKESVYSLVKKIRNDERVRISLDLYSVGILFFSKKYYKRNYILSF